MNQKLLKRLEALERATERLEIPSLILMSYDEENVVWVVSERYYRHDGKGNVTRGGYTKMFTVKTPEDYQPPKGFKGTMIIESILE